MLAHAEYLAVPYLVVVCCARMSTRVSLQAGSKVPQRLRPLWRRLHEEGAMHSWCCMPGTELSICALPAFTVLNPRLYVNLVILCWSSCVKVACRCR
jgi:hypothetical protein